MNYNDTQKPIDKIVRPVQRFIQQEKSGGLLLGISVIVALLLANTPLSILTTKSLSSHSASGGTILSILSTTSTIGLTTG